MPRALRIPLLILVAAVVPGCHDDDDFGLGAEREFLAQDVTDLMTIVFQASENAFVGDVVVAGEVVEEALPANGFMVTYDLLPDARDGLGEGFGRGMLQVTEDGVPNPDPLSFSFDTTPAQTVEVSYSLHYAGRARSGRATNVVLEVMVTAVRTGSSDFVVDYFVTGHCDLGATFCDRLLMHFRANGRPEDGIVGGFGDGEGLIFDPDVRGAFDLDLDWFSLEFRAGGDVQCVHCAFYESKFAYSLVQ
jgi:hypothetical protein